MTKNAEKPRNLLPWHLQTYIMAIDGVYLLAIKYASTSICVYWSVRRYVFACNEVCADVYLRTIRMHRTCHLWVHTGKFGMIFMLKCHVESMWFFDSYEFFRFLGYKSELIFRLNLEFQTHNLQIYNKLL